VAGGGQRRLACGGLGTAQELPWHLELVERTRDIGHGLQVGLAAKQL